MNERISVRWAHNTMTLFNVLIILLINWIAQKNMTTTIIKVVNSKNKHNNIKK